MEDIKILISGDKAISVQMGSEISLEVNRKVLMLQAELEKNPIAGVTETLPTYASLMVHYNPEIVRVKELSEEIMKRTQTMQDIAAGKKRIVEVPICYGGEYGPDLEYCAELEHTTPEEIIRKHSKSFGGSLNNNELKQMCNISEPTLLKYKKEIRKEMIVAGELN